MPAAVLIDALRTPFARGHAEKGWFRKRRADELAAECLQALLARNGLAGELVDDVTLGCVYQVGEQGGNLARTAALLAGVSPSTGAVTVNRLCGSGLQAFVQAAHAIAAGESELQLVGGAEQMSRYGLGAIDASPRLYAATSPYAGNMGLTAELLARREQISRDEQDAWALTSQQRAAAAYEAGFYSAELLPTQGCDGNGAARECERDQGLRDDCTTAALAALRPAFLHEGGTVTAGNSSPVSDGAAALLIASETRARALGLTPKARIVATAVAGVEPALMGLGPVAAVQKLLARARLTAGDIDLWEINEAFAVQVIACQWRLGLDPGRVNVHGGALALGHPLGASGARLAGTLMHALGRRQARLGVAALCIGFGQGMAVLLERVC